MVHKNGNKNIQISKTKTQNVGANWKIFICFNAANNIHKAIWLDCELGDDYCLLFLISDINSITIKTLNLTFICDQY